MGVVGADGEDRTPDLRFTKTLHYRCATPAGKEASSVLPYHCGAAGLCRPSAIRRQSAHMALTGRISKAGRECAGKPACSSPSPRRYSAINPSARFVPGDREGNGTALQNLFSVRVTKVAAHIAPPDLAVGATLQPYHRHCQSQPEDHTPYGASGLSEPFCPCGWVAIITLPIQANKREPVGAGSLVARGSQHAPQPQSPGERGLVDLRSTSLVLNPGRTGKRGKERPASRSVSGRSRVSIRLRRREHMRYFGACAFLQERQRRIQG